MTCKTGEPSGSEGAGTGQGASQASARAGPSPVTAVWAGVREPVVVILLLIAFFTWISGKPLDGLLMLVAGVCLAWDTARRARHASQQAAGQQEASQQEASQQEGSQAAGSPAGTVRQSPPPAAAWRRRLLALAWLAAGALYVVLVGSFSRYSWPATVAVVALGVAVVVTGWRSPRHASPAPVTLPAAGLALWGLVLVAGCLWELWSLLQQPTLTTDSYAHPTISTLTDPVLSTWAGRSVILAAWLGLGWFLVER